MEGFADFIVEFLQINEEIPFRTVVIGILIYLMSLWFVISVWVYFDARKRYESSITAFLFALLTFFLNFPLLIFYFAVRPDITFEDFDDWEAGGVNVPIVNFMGKQGIEMSLELRVNPKKLRDSHKSPDMNVEIGWDNNDEKFRLIDRDELAEEILKAEMSKKDARKKRKTKLKVFNYFDAFSGRVRRYVSEAKGKVSKKIMSIKKQTKKDKNKGKDKTSDSKDKNGLNNAEKIKNQKSNDHNKSSKQNLPKKHKKKDKKRKKKKK